MSEEREINELLDAFGRDPAAALDALPPKVDRRGAVAHASAFSASETAVLERMYAAGRRRLPHILGDGDCRCPTV
ncbi:MAG: hypothetical protein KC420_17460 [Myxococcales bacterium]|nr:hypothetical protein [Myxococcales bacterium]